MKVFLHLGPHKTGTTSLQFLLHRRFSAPEPQRIWYPPEVRGGWGHVPLAEAALPLYGPRTDPEVMTGLLTRAREGGCEVLLLSSEEFSRILPEGMEAFRAQFQDVEVRPILTFTPFGRRSLSLWQEQVKWGDPTPIDVALPRIFRSAIFFPPFLERLVDLFEVPRPALLVVAPTGDPQQLYRDFREATGLPELLDEGEAPPLLNPSLGRVEVEVFRGLAEGLRAVHSVVDGAQRQRYVNLLYGLFTSPEWQETGPRAPLQLPEPWRAELAPRVREYLSALTELAASGAIEVFGDLAALDDL